MICYYLTDIQAVSKCSSSSNQVYFLYDVKKGWVQDEWAITASHLYRPDYKGTAQEVPESEMKKRIKDKAYCFDLKAYLHSSGIPEASGIEAVIAELAKRSHSILPKGALRIALTACAANMYWGKYYFGAPSALCRDFIGLNFFYIYYHDVSEFQNKEALSTIDKIRNDLTQEMDETDYQYINENSPHDDQGNGSDQEETGREKIPHVHVAEQETADAANETGKRSEQNSTGRESEKAGNDDGMDPALRAAAKCYTAKDYDGTIQILMQAIDKALPQLRNTEEYEFHDFYNAMEVTLFQYYFKPKKEQKITNIPIAQYYRMWGSTLLDKGKLEEARGPLSKALFWNPTRFEIMAEYMETFKSGADLETFGRLSRQAIIYAISSKQVARVMRNMGWYFSEKEQFLPAEACFRLSLVWEKENPVAKNELNYITARTGKPLHPFTWDQVKDLGSQYQFPLGADGNVIGLARLEGEQSLKNNQKDAAAYSLVHT